MTDKTQTCEGFLGRINTVVVGCPHYRTPLLPGEEMRLEREPGNAHDPMAIRVTNSEGRQAGYLPRRMARWLAPLLDADRLRVRGSVCSQGPRNDDRIPITLELLSGGSAGEVPEGGAPDTVDGVVHEAVLRAYELAGDLTEPDDVARLGRRLSATVRSGGRPETHLVLALFGHKADEVRRKRLTPAVDGVRATLRDTAVGEGITWGPLTVFPLSTARPLSRDYLLLEEAGARGLATVREVSAQGSVPELLVENHGPVPLFLAEGEIIAGLKQNRVLNIAVMVPPMGRCVVPVSCVERGRWHTRQPGFHTQFHASPGVRARKNASVRANRRGSGAYASDQGGVWSAVDIALRQAGVSSETDSLTDVYAQTRHTLDACVGQVRIPERTAGVLVMSGGHILGVDLFDSHETFDHFWDRLLASYFVEAGVREHTEQEATRDRAALFLRQLEADLTPCAGVPGAGIQVECEGPEGTGNALWFDGRVRHLAAFPGTGAEW